MTEKKKAEQEQQNDPQTLEEAFAVLDQWIQILEEKDTSLEDSFQIYQKGMELIKKCSDKIDQVETKILVMNEEGGLDEF